MAKRVAVVLAGCGVKDGSEIHEAVLTILAVVRAGAEPLFFAPNQEQPKVVNHLTQGVQPDKRNMLFEAARIARGNIKDLRECQVDSADALIFPGGMGAACNLSDFAERGSECTVLPDVRHVIEGFYNAGKPQGFICIAPAIAACVLGSRKIKLTIGRDKATATKLEQMGAVHVATPVRDVCVDHVHKVVSTPAYMLGRNIFEIEPGISKLVTEVLK